MFPLKDNIPLGRIPLVTIALIVINVIAYLLEIRHGGSFWSGPSESVAVHYGAIPYELTHPGDHCDLTHSLGGQGLPGTVLCQGRTPGIAGGAEAQPATWVTVLSAMFLHGSFLHIFGNMLFLAIFGPSVEDRIGRPRYLAFYLIGGLVALAAQTAVDPGSTAPMLGASGAIAAVLGGYILLFPRARILALVVIIFFVTIIEIPAIVMLGLWFAEQLWLGLSGLAEPLGGAGVAYFAHIGGFAFGLAAIRLFAPAISPGYGRTLGR
jgi:membrane associated rhomboid family serine protease